MKRTLFLSISLHVFCCMSATGFSQSKLGDRLFKKEVGIAALEAGRAATLSDEQVADMTRDYVALMDERNPVADDNHPYAIRLNELVKQHENEGGLNLNFKVYLVKEVNAFACADGSVRVWAGLMDLMNDGELLGVIGHEIGHVKGGDTKDAIRTAYLASAARNAAASQGGKVAEISKSELGDVAERLVNSKFSQKQELNADDYSVVFLKTYQYEGNAMVTALQKLQKLTDAAGKNGMVSRLFSSHPDTAIRAERIQKKLR